MTRYEFKSKAEAVKAVGILAEVEDGQPKMRKRAWLVETPLPADQVRSLLASLDGLEVQ